MSIAAAPCRRPILDRPWVVPLILLLLAVGIAAVRSRTVDEPLERDLATYMLIGHAMNAGGQAYVDAWDIKPPGVYAVYAAAERLVGLGEPQAYLLSVFFGVATLVAVYAAGAVRGRVAGLWAALFWCLLWSAATLQANQPNTEVFINATVIAALAILLYAPFRGRSLGTAMAAGALFAVATSFKQLAIVDAAILCAVHIAVGSDLPGGRKQAVRDVAIIAAIGAAFWFGMIGYYAATARSELFWTTIFTSTRAYAGNPLFNAFRYLRELKVFPHFLWFAAPVVLLILAGCIRDRSTLLRRPWALYLGATAAVHIKIILNGTSFLPHYYQYWLPLLAIGAAWTAAGGDTEKSTRPVVSCMTAAAAAVTLFIAVNQGQWWFRPAADWSRLKYGNNVLEARELGRMIDRLLRDGERVYQHGNCPELYLYSRRRPLSPLLWTLHIGDTWPAADMLIELHLAALKKTPPDLIVIERRDREPAMNAAQQGFVWRLLVGKVTIDKGLKSQRVLDTLLPDYRSNSSAAWQPYPRFEFFVRRGSALEKRLGPAGSPY